MRTTLLHRHTLGLEEPLIGVEPTPPSFFAHALHALRPQVVGGHHKRHALALVDLVTGEVFALDQRHVTRACADIVISALNILYANALGCRWRDLQQACRTAAALGRRVELRLLERQRREVQPVHALRIRMTLQHGSQLFKTLQVVAHQRVVDLEGVSVSVLESQVMLSRWLIALEEVIHTGAQQGRVVTHEPADVTMSLQGQIPVYTQLGHDPGPALGNGLFDQRHRVDTGLDHFQYVFDRQSRVDPFDFRQRQLAQLQLPIDLMQRLIGRAAGGQAQRSTGQLIDPTQAALAANTDQDQRHVMNDRGTGLNAFCVADVEQFARRDQITLTALQRTQQLILGFGNDLEGDLAAIAGVTVEILFERFQTMVFNAYLLPLDVARTVATLVDQYPQDFTAANGRQVTHLGLVLHSFRAGLARRRVQGQQRQKTHEGHKRGSNHSFTPGNAGKKTGKRKSLRHAAASSS
ncbi:hypothetical protein ALQ62_101369 [Pseudomonas coronafaciens pv. zizaniae]|nr:hypothetical protein ALQ62_101369 [Pseudomonas coronafaciens pv. zizaniae]